MTDENGFCACWSTVKNAEHVNAVQVLNTKGMEKNQLAITCLHSMLTDVP